MAFVHTVRGESFRFDDLKTLLAKATPARSGDELAGIAAADDTERVAAQMALAELPSSFSWTSTSYLTNPTRLPVSLSTVTTQLHSLRWGT